MVSETDEARKEVELDEFKAATHQQDSTLDSQRQHCLSSLAADAWCREMPYPAIIELIQVGGIDDT